MRGILWNAVLFVVASGVIWVLSGMLLESTSRVARRFHRSGFAAAFLLLGILTSISELSVATNATLEGAPQVSVGNLVGASLVIFLLIVPLLAIFGRGITLAHSLSRKKLVLALFVIAAPALLIADGDVSRVEGLLMVGLYAVLLYLVQSREKLESAVHSIDRTMPRGRSLVLDIGKLMLGAGLIFVASRVLVEQSVYFSAVLRIPASFIGLVILSVGTNIPEIVIAARSVMRRQKELAFGDYVGSAATNTLILGLLALVNGRFPLEQGAFGITFLFLAAGLILVYVFSRSRNDISRREGIAILSLYVAFLVVQILTVG